MTYRARHVCLALIPGLISLITGSYLIRTAKWLDFGVPTTGTHFGDLKVILFASECAQRDPSWSIASSPCAPEMAIYNYPSLWAKAFSVLGVGSASAAAVTLIFIVLFACSLSVLAFMSMRAGNEWFPVAVLSVVGISPPALLAFERGNIDLLIFALTIGSVALLVSGLARSSAVVLGIATFLKIFPVGSAVMFTTVIGRRRSTAVIYLVTATLGFAFILRDLPTIYARTPALDGASFGSAIVPLLALNQAGGQGHLALAKLIGLLIFAVLAIALFLVGKRGHDVLALHKIGHALQADSVASILVLAGGGSFLAAYLIGPSFDYRLITLIPVIAGLARIETRTGRTVTVIVIAQLILSYSTYVGAAEYLSDLMLMVIAPALLVLVFQLARGPKSISF